jgi:hypothetical protein
VHCTNRVRSNAIDQNRALSNIFKRDRTTEAPRANAVVGGRFTFANPVFAHGAMVHCTNRVRSNAIDQNRALSNIFKRDRTTEAPRANAVVGGRFTFANPVFAHGAMVHCKNRVRSNAIDQNRALSNTIQFRADVDRGRCYELWNVFRKEESGRGRDRTGDTAIFNRMLYQLSYPTSGTRNYNTHQRSCNSVQIQASLN